MALDSRDKRASALGVGLAFLLGAPVPDGSLSAADRQHIAGAYRGVLASEASDPVVSTAPVVVRAALAGVVRSATPRIVARRA